ncbi:MAG: HD domain-containing protein [Candidatus Moraniibacteriota bacterium]
MEKDEQKKLSISFEKAVRFLAKYMPVSDENSRKPALFHDIRVGVYLYEHGYGQDTVLAGVLHDAIEWSGASEQLVRDEFGDEVVRLVLASTKDDSITDGKEKTKELIQRCVKNGQEALIVKTADILDSFKWYSSQNNESEIQYCVRNANAILEYRPDDFDDKIFGELKVWQEKFSK